LQVVELKCRPRQHMSATTGRVHACRRNGVEIRPSPGLLGLSCLAGMGLGALNEMLEFFVVLTIPDTNVGGYVNTGWDLVFNALGAAIAVVLIAVTYALRDRNRPIDEPSVGA
jgi:hypothetical protein